MIILKDNKFNNGNKQQWDLNNDNRRNNYTWQWDKKKAAANKSQILSWAQKSGLIVFWLIYFDSGSRMGWSRLKMPFIIGSPVLLSSFASHLIAIFNRRNTSVKFRQRKLRIHQQISTYHFGFRRWVLRFFSFLEQLLVPIQYGDHSFLCLNLHSNKNLTTLDKYYNRPLNSPWKRAI